MKNETKTTVPPPTGQDLFEAACGEMNFVMYDGDVISGVSELQIIYSDGDGIVHYLGIDEIDSGKLKFHITGQFKSLPWPEYYARECPSRPFVPEEWGWEHDKEMGWHELGTRFILWNWGESRKLNISYWGGERIFSGYIPTAREYLSLAGMLGIGIPPNNQENG